MYQDRMGDDADWKDGINAFRARMLESILCLESKLDICMQRIRDLEEPPKAPRPPKKEEELKL